MNNHYNKIIFEERGIVLKINRIKNDSGMRWRALVDVLLICFSQSGFDKINICIGAIGGGAELTTACDYRMMSNKVETTVIGFPHAKMGIVPAWGSTGRLISITGYQNAMDLLLDCRLLKAAEAMDIGLVDGTMATLQDVTDWLSLKTRHPVNVIRAIKGSLSCYGDGVDQRASELIESKIFAPLWGGSADQHHDTADKSD